MKQPQSTLSDAAIAALRDGHDIEAIRIVREHSGLSLAEAKQAIDAHRAGARANVAASVADSIPLAAIGMLEAGDLIGAIKATRNNTDLGLKDAKQKVERYLASQPGLRERFKAAALRKHSGIVRVVVAVIVAMAVIYAAVVLLD